MAIGIAAAIIVLAYVYQEYNYDSRQENSDNTYRILLQNEQNKLSGSTTYGPLAKSLQSDFPEIKDATRISFYGGYLALSTGERKFNETKTIFADPNFFSLLSFPLKRGDASKCLDSPNSILLSESTATRYFGDNSALGKQIKIGEKRTVTVQGVFHDFEKNSNFSADIILPLQSISKLTQVWIEPSWKYPSDIHTFILAENEADATTIQSKIANYLSVHVAKDPEKLALQPLKNIHIEKYTGWESVPQANTSYLYLLLVFALVILAMSAVNFLMLFIGMNFRRTVATFVKKVCGASQTSLFVDYLKETLSYVTISTLFAIGIIVIYHSLLVDNISFLPKIYYINNELFLILSSVVLVYAVIISVFSALYASRQNPENIFKFKYQPSNKQPQLLNVLVLSQFAVSIILFAVTILFYKQIYFLGNHNPGYARSELMTIPLNMRIDDGLNGSKFDAFTQELKKIRGVENATLAFSSPADVQTSTGEFRSDGMPDGKTVEMQWNSVYYDYFETVGVSIVDGRGFSHNFKNDMFNFESGKSSYVINRKAAQEMGIENPIGKTLHAYGDGPIVGIVEDFNFKSLHSEITPMCFNMNRFYYNDIIVRLDPQVAGIVSDIEVVWKKFVPEYPFEFTFVDHQLTQMYKAEDDLTSILNIFAGIAILIACMGLLALAILSMQKRTKEIGIRKVNGATISEVMILLNKDFIKWVAVAFIIATPIAYFVMQKWLENFAYKTNLSWWIFPLAGILALVISLLTVSWKSWKTATRNPVEALRYE
jgi:putative ABC transport system permease protein